MDFKKYEYNLVFHVILLTFTISLFSWVLFSTNFFYTAAFIFLFIPMQTWYIIRIVRRTNRKLVSFFNAIKHAEFNYNYSSQEKGSTFSDLSQILDEIITQFKTLTQNKEELYFFYQSIIQHIDISLIAYKSNGQILLSNNATNRLFNLNNFSNIKQLNDIDPNLYNVVDKLEDGQKELVKTQVDNDFYFLSVHLKTIRQEAGIIKVVVIQNIQTELEQQEIESWQKLIRVLTHEIMNSITPVTSLTDTLKTMFDAQTAIDAENIDDIKLAINTIHKRSNGLLQFVDTYRNLTRIPQPKFEIVNVANFISEMIKLFESECAEKKVVLISEIQNQELEMMVDESMMERVLINLIKNAIQAVAGTPDSKITIKTFSNQIGNVVIQVIDCGHGILPDVIDKIFIPFFSTRAGGSGIGLALSRQLIRAQGGTISAFSEPNLTIFTIRL